MKIWMAVSTTDMKVLKDEILRFMKQGQEVRILTDDPAQAVQLSRVVHDLGMRDKIRTGIFQDHSRDDFL